MGTGMGTGKKIGIGIIGCGKAGKYHAGWYSKNPDCLIKGFYNRTTSKALELSEKYRSKTYENWEELVKDPEINVVSICTPVGLHKEQAAMALNLKKHVLCEKPMAASSEECEFMVNLAKINGVNLGVFFNMRFNPVIETVDSNISAIGEILSIDMNFQFNREDLGWRGRQGSKTGVLMELGTHAIDLALYWLGDIAVIHSEIGNFKKDSYCDDHAFVIWRFASGAIGKLYASYNDPGFYDEQIEGLIVQILGREGKICFLLNSYYPERNRVFTIKNNKKKEICLKKPEICDDIYPGHMNSFGKLIDKFVNSVMENKTFRPSGEDGLKTIKFVEDVFRSSKWRF
ncbi:MAG: Gfo/Idh/MocA family oxidoreductase [Actinobacteria bacterium]|nr:Gfo/Idh/MocA family oxidoreductase [Actinomycetota bacterium]